MKLKQMAVTDLDGTLLNGNHTLSDRNLKALQNLAKHEIVRVIATGRSLFSYFRAGFESIPVDYLIFSSGAGIYHLREKKIILSLNLSPQEASYAFQTLLGEKLDFSVQQQIPENHRYVYVFNSASNPDFERRNKLYEGFCNEIIPGEFKKDVYCQLIAICPPGTGVDKYQKIKELLPGFSVIRSTSPIDHQSVWIEVFNKNVSKLNGIRFLSDHLNIGLDSVFCCGNDYNDLEMLEACPNAYVVDNAPQEFKQKFHTVSSHHEDGFSQAVEHWLSS